MLTSGVAFRLGALAAVFGVSLAAVALTGTAAIWSLGSDAAALDTQGIQPLLGIYALNGDLDVCGFGCCGARRCGRRRTRPSCRAKSTRRTGRSPTMSWLPYLLPGGLDAQREALVRAFQQRLDDYRAVRDAEFLPASRANDSNVAAVEPKLEDLGLGAGNALDAVTELETTHASELSARAGHTRSSSQRSVLVAAVIGVLGVLGLAVVIVRSVTMPLRALEHRLGQIADGDGDLTQRLDGERRDEMGRVGRALTG